ncbi:Uncharacterized protein P5673_005061 [Acropora cervicornis]|uniref:ZMYM2-like/QRICH1 C-terminal domain-containing protein n=1 Tax=Acropora cervicornis TaxID=6130 RepID=A0AAD9R040_ACRCE|nr:Uncharacterized protein P5673_005061 [Acropora cervicornis]
MINDLFVADTILWKYVHNTTLVESVSQNGTSYMQLRVDELVRQSEADGFQLNESKWNKAISSMICCRHATGPLIALVARDTSNYRFVRKIDKPSDTTKKTKTDLNVWTRWCNSINERRPMEDIPLEELNSLLAHFFIKVRKLNGEEFEPGTLTSFQRSFDRYLRQHGKNYMHKIFESSREALESKRKQLRLSGKGTRPNKALGLTNDEVEKFWSEKQLGDHSPQALLRTVWLNNTMHFGWRARDEHRKVLLGDLEIRQEEGRERRE